MFNQIKEYLSKLLKKDEGSPSSLNTPKSLLIGTVVVLFILVLWLSSQLIFGSRDNAVISRSLVIQQVKDVSELTTAIFETENIIDVKKKGGIGGVGESKLLYIAHGSMRVGFDLSEFHDDDILIENNKITVNLPPLKVLDTKLDVNESRVYDYSRGWLINLGPDVVELVESAQREAITKIEESACKDWLIKTANERVKQIAQRFLNLFMNDKGYTVTVKVKIYSDSSCVQHQV
ncbi:DUF4230 domain-containing protein [Pseudanabaena sp. ABRG5-3]|uniref:DUF4230 domain-containing protein n=1 Tax=Pseudanabaena sp. ABRG5-3 TaxID=685565 RepID=UPI000DC72DF0|nr:DUF4230 domain-containing protein [Pseudanabaena sp. ABRG5-3]BBC23708.1 hypothetical protein ABRG53_1451 [Pseudanabaena sp. ABRG5-3]